MRTDESGGGGGGGAVGGDKEIKKSWPELREEVRNIRRRIWSFSHRLPHSFTFRRMGNGRTRIYFMCSPPNSRDNSVFAIDVPSSAPTNPSSTSIHKDNLSKYPWIQILPPGFQGGAPPTKAELLMMERKRMTPTGIAAYEFHEASAKFVFTASSSLFQCMDDASKEYPLSPSEIRTPLTSGARMNAEICPNNPHLIAFVNNGDLWIVNSLLGEETRLTYTREEEGESEEAPLSAGLPSYIIQEEFNRFHGFWWQPDYEDNIYRILYEEVDESKVSLVSLLTLPGREPEKYRFPTPGSPNASSRLRILEFKVGPGGSIGNITHRDLPYPISQHFSWAEYIVRCGWTMDGNYIWTQLLNRTQQRLELVLFPLDEAASAPAYVIYAEETNVWINVHDLLTFLPSVADNCVNFIWASEETGFRHIYYIQSQLRPALTQPWTKSSNPALCLSPKVERKVQLTSGDWEVMNAQVAVRYDCTLLFFIGLCDSPIERHLYAVSIKEPGQIRRLTPLGFSYTAFFNGDCSMVILTFSSTKTPPVCILYSVQYTDATVNGIHLLPLTYFTEPAQVDGAFRMPDIHSYKMSSGEELFAMVYKPFTFSEDKKYPTILNVYGGPEVQLVFNSFRGTGQWWLYLLASQGYCVVAIDSRGSHHRGVQFESHIRRRMGTVELEDQVEVLEWLANKEKYIDLNRVGIYGWSYGGYLSLMALAKYPQLFKVCVAGAPVTSWELYDSGYTERYMDLPESNPLGYKQGSVLTHVQQFPDELGRLLLVHGLNDENVHFVHTAELLNCLIRFGKPYQLQVYPSERHSLRRLDATEHYETMLLAFLQNSL